MAFRTPVAPENFSAFTLVELLLVIAVIAILSSILLTIGSSAVEKGREVRARAELAALSAGLESYRRAYGDYPRVDRADLLLQALIGKRGPAGAELRGPAFIDVAHLMIEGGKDPFVDATALTLDPWGEAYHYEYKTSGAWIRPDFALFSAGRDQRSAALLATGFHDEGAAENRDDIYADR
jgi:general secretion pathway protein G